MIPIKVKIKNRVFHIEPDGSQVLVHRGFKKSVAKDGKESSIRQQPAYLSNLASAVAFIFDQIGREINEDDNVSDLQQLYHFMVDTKREIMSKLTY